MKRFIVLSLALFFTRTDLLQAEIREFDKATLERLGREIYVHDTRAATATDLLLAQKLDSTKEGLRGWIVVLDGKAMVVRFVREKAGALEAFYDVRFEGENKPTIKKAARTRLSDFELAQFKARTLALKNITRPAANNKYNFVVLLDLERKGFLVYALAATTDPDEIVFSGHHRFSITLDGTTITDADELFKSFANVRKIAPDKLGGKNVVGLFITSLVNDLPLETHVYLSLLHKTPILVGAGRHIWRVENGKMEIIK